MPVDLYFETLARIVAAVGVPVTADIEGGYADDPASVAASAWRVRETGVVGINIEDGGTAPSLLADKIAAIRAAAGPPLFIKARVDVYLRGIAADRPLAEVIARASLYHNAGCDGIFVPGVTDAGDIAALVAGIDAPLNVMARPGLSDAATLAAMGVRRLSAGSTLDQAALGLTAQLATNFLAGNAGQPFDVPLSYSAINALMRQS